MIDTENTSSFEKFSEMNSKKAFQNTDKPIIIADRLRTPENMGSVLRLAGNIGAEKVFFISDVAQLFKHHKIKKTASGAAEKCDWEIVDQDDLTKIIPSDYQLIAIETSETADNIYNTSFPKKCAFIVGNEVYGIRPKILSQASQHVYIPVPGFISSLNVTHALSIALFEWLRQQQ